MIVICIGQGSRQRRGRIKQLGAPEAYSAGIG
jgi:hypothetical protein